MQWSNVQELDVPTAIARTRAIVRTVEESQLPWVATTLVSGPALVMGALQREERVRWRYRDLGVYPAETRATTGTSLLVSKTAIQQLIVVPMVHALYSDANPANFINRSVRGLLRAYNAIGARGHYFGREHFTLSRRPAGVLGVDVTLGGAWILEAWVGVEEPAPLDGFRNHAPIALREALREAQSKRADDTALGLAERLHQKLRGAFAVAAAERAGEEPPAIGAQLSPPVVNQGWEFVSREVPIGELELGRRGREYCFRGDLMCSVDRALRFEEQLAHQDLRDAVDAFSGAPFEGAQLADLQALLWKLEPTRTS
ncbi:MAG: hypothetical protein R3B07_18270 [Polyangiaceae bacterium]